MWKAEKSWEKAEKIEKSGESLKVIRKFDQIIRSKDKNIWLAYQEGKIFENCIKNAKPFKMVKQFSVSKSTIIFKINIVKLITKYPKIKNSSLFLIFLKNHLKLFKEICEENKSEFELVKNLIKIH